MDLKNRSSETSDAAEKILEVNGHAGVPITSTKTKKTSEGPEGKIAVLSNKEPEDSEAIQAAVNYHCLASPGATNDVDGSGGNSDMLRPGKGDFSLVNGVMEKSRVGPVSSPHKDDLPLDRLQTSVCGGQPREHSVGLPVPSSGGAAPENFTSKVSCEDQIQTTRNLHTNETDASKGLNNISVETKVLNNDLSVASASSSSAITKVNESKKHVDVGNESRITDEPSANAEPEISSLDNSDSKAVSSILSALEDNIVRNFDESDAKSPLPKIILKTESDHNGKVTYEVGGASGNEVNVSFSDNFNHESELCEVVEAPIIKKNFTPLTTKDEKKNIKENVSSEDVSLNGLSCNKNNAEKVSAVDNILGDIIVDPDVIGAPLGKEVLNVSTSKDGLITRQTGGASGKEITITIKNRTGDENKIPVEEEVIKKERFSPLGSEDKLALDKLPFREKSVIESAVKRRFGNLSIEPKLESEADILSTKTSSEQELIVADLKENLDSLWSDLDDSLQSAIQSAKKKTTSPTSAIKSKVTDREPNHHPSKELIDRQTTRGAEQGSPAQVLRALNSIKIASSLSSNPYTSSQSSSAASSPSNRRLGRHRDKCVRFSSLDAALHGRSVDCYPIKEEPSSPVENVIVATQVLHENVPLRATLAEEEEFDDIEIFDEKFTLETNEKESSAVCEDSSVPKPPIATDFVNKRYEKHEGQSSENGENSLETAHQKSPTDSERRKIRSERSGFVASLIGNFESSSPVRKNSFDKNRHRSSKDSSPSRSEDEEHGLTRSRVTKTFSKEHGKVMPVEEKVKSEVPIKPETSPKPEKLVKKFKSAKPVVVSAKRDTSPHSEKTRSVLKGIKTVEKEEEPILVSFGGNNDEAQFNKSESKRATTTAESDNEKNIIPEEVVPTVKITLTEASPEKKLSVNNDTDLVFANGTSDEPSKDRVVVFVFRDPEEDITIETENNNIELSSNDEKTINVQEESETQTADYSINVSSESDSNDKELHENIPESKSESKCSTEPLPKIGWCVEPPTSPSASASSKEPEPGNEITAKIQDTILDAQCNDELHNVNDECRDSDEENRLKKSENPPSPFDEEPKQESTLSNSSSQTIKASEKTSLTVNTVPVVEETEKEIKPPTIVEPSTDCYLNPCKELLATSVNKSSQGNSSNPFGDSEEESEEAITVVVDSSKNPISSPSKSLNPFDDDESEELAENGGISAIPESLRSTPSPLPRNSIPPKPTPRASKLSIGGSNPSLYCLDTKNSTESLNWPYALRSPLNVSTLSTKSLNPFDESEEEDDSRGGFQRYHKGNASVRGGEGKFNTVGKGKFRGSLPMRRTKRRAPLPPGMQAPSPSPAHGPLTSSPSTPAG
ncbi:uncharacterized protein LOC108676739 [Hyalella azteca]|uniref:Uncharacterized protein LOC108676739 n=1 Tax=Hyalella azteca TaxID=294128 RepID=A0A8B7P318_HYAAZ|nr:uncharacterized protein LOC108676739 [Hyalella azteca]